jgi:hypothetical protein
MKMIRQRLMVCVLSMGVVMLGLVGVLTAVQPSHAENNPSLGSLSDEFDDAATMANWIEGPSTAYDLLDIDTINPGYMTFVPTSFPNNAWYGTYVAPYRYKLVTGNFAVQTYVIAGNRNAPDPTTAPPTGQYNSAGFVARDPASDPAGPQNYVMFNLGFQANNLSTEVKTTVDSTSILTLTSTINAYEGQLLLCRLGNSFHTYRRLTNDSSWVALDVVHHNGLPVTLQVGLVANAWEETNGSDLYALFDYVRFAEQPPTVPNDCLAAFAPPMGDERVYLPMVLRE